MVDLTLAMAMGAMVEDMGTLLLLHGVLVFAAGFSSTTGM